MWSLGSIGAQIGTLIVATSVVQVANGFFGTFFSLRVAIEDFDATMAGLVLSAYFAGFTVMSTVYRSASRKHMTACRPIVSLP